MKKLMLMCLCVLLFSGILYAGYVSFTDPSLPIIRGYGTPGTIFVECEDTVYDYQLSGVLLTGMDVAFSVFQRYPYKKYLVVKVEYIVESTGKYVTEEWFCKISDWILHEKGKLSDKEVQKRFLFGYRIRDGKINCNKELVKGVCSVYMRNK